MLDQEIYDHILKLISEAKVLDELKRWVTQERNEITIRAYKLTHFSSLKNKSMREI